MRDEENYNALLAFADRIEDACEGKDHCSISVSDDAIEIIRDCVANARRYKWLAEHPSLSVSNFMGKYRVTDSDNVITEWFASRDEAIDIAMELVK